MNKRQSEAIRSPHAPEQTYKAEYELYLRAHGEVQEWLNWPLSKSGIEQSIEGSNPSLSASKNTSRLDVRYFY